MLAVAIGVVVGQVMLSVVTVASGAMSQMVESQQVVVRTTDEWWRLWARHAPNADAPDVDFDESMVVGVFLGRRPTPAFRVEITAVEAIGDQTVVTFIEHRPDPGAMVARVLSAPYHLIRVERRPATVRFEQYRCAGPMTGSGERRGDRYPWSTGLRNR